LNDYVFGVNDSGAMLERRLPSAAITVSGDARWSQTARAWIRSALTPFNVLEGCHAQREPGVSVAFAVVRFW
jgi:hypothetical protein